MKAIRVHTFGGPEVLQYEDIPEPAPKSGEAVIKIDAAGVNFIDTYHRTVQDFVAGHARSGSGRYCVGRRLRRR
jgi:NADPH:quinone reductase-like Zn-dependent oxidoreductase